jgi:DNA-directed RNA polymerase subunit RPC12/RpoP
MNLPTHSTNVILKSYSGGLCMNFNNYIYKLNNYFKNRYGLDKFSKCLFIAGALFSLVKPTILFGPLLIGYGAFRCLSKNKYKRYQELNSFENLIRIGENPVKNQIIKLEQRRHYKIYKCPNCSQKLRIPRKQGKVTITCRACKTEFKGKS